MSTNSYIPEEHMIKKFYIDHLDNFGDSSKGVGWKNEEAQLIRFEQLAKVINEKTNFSINDLGCGTGSFFDYLKGGGFSDITFNGYDILDEMLIVAKEKHKNQSNLLFKKIASAQDMNVADYSIESGIFNVKYEATEEEWLRYVLVTLQQMNEKSTKGFAFNLLTSYSDKEHMQNYLYYANPCFFFDYCKKNFSKNIALLHDYNQYDFTILVRK